MLKNIAENKKLAFLMFIIMGFHIMSGMKLFCGSLSKFPTQNNVMLSLQSNLHELSVPFTEWSRGLSKSQHCNCKSKPSCSAIPKFAVFSNMGTRVYEHQKHTLTSVCYPQQIVTLPSKNLGVFFALLQNAASISSSTNPVDFQSVLLI